MNRSQAFAAGALLLAAGSVFAQDEQPAVGAPTSSPSVTTIVGDQESPRVLYITPWRESIAEPELDRPARLLDEAMVPVDPDAFSRHVEYHDALTAHRAGANPATPPAP